MPYKLMAIGMCILLVGVANLFGGMLWAIWSEGDKGFAASGIAIATPLFIVLVVFWIRNFEKFWAGP